MNTEKPFWEITKPFAIQCDNGWSFDGKTYLNPDLDIKMFCFLPWTASLEEITEITELINSDKFIPGRYSSMHQLRAAHGIIPSPP